jgi:hypothetical protein
VPWLQAGGIGGGGLLEAEGEVAAGWVMALNRRRWR